MKKKNMFLALPIVLIFEVAIIYGEERSNTNNLESSIMSLNSKEVLSRLGTKIIRVIGLCKRAGKERLTVTYYDRAGVPNISHSVDMVCREEKQMIFQDFDLYARSTSYSIKFQSDSEKQ